MEDAEKLFCDVCGDVDEHYDEYSELMHGNTAKHKCNLILANYKQNKRYFSKNREGIFVFCKAEGLPLNDAPVHNIEDSDHHKVRIYAKPNQKVKFSYKIRNDMKKEDVLIVGIHLAHGQPQFQMNDHPYIFGGDGYILEKKSSIDNEVYVSFKASDIGQFEMPIMFTFHRRSDKKNIIIIREMVVMVQENPVAANFIKSPFTNEDFGPVDHFIPSVDHESYHSMFKIPKLLKKLFPIGLNEDELEKLKISRELKDQLRAVLITTRSIFDEGITERNYSLVFHHLLWWEEVNTRINLRKYNMAEVTLTLDDEGFWLEVPGLAEKRPSLLRGDRVFLRPQENPTLLFESIIDKIKENCILLSKIDETFDQYYSETALFDIRFLMSRVPLERMHLVTSQVFSSKQICRLFPEPAKKIIPVKPILKFYNPLIEHNHEQRSAVEHILSKSSGLAPYIVFGPPGTGKTMTIVEAIIQIVKKHPSHRVMVCTDSNMAADHIAVMLLKYNQQLNINRFILRANSRNREWSIMPPELIPISNGSNYETFFSVNNEYAASYRILVTTLLHAAKYESSRNSNQVKIQMTHLFIDEAAQAKEPAALVPIVGLLSPKGQLVLAGDPKQLGPVCISRGAHEKGLGTSLLERLFLTYQNLYRNDSNYITTLVKNFRSDPDILQIPNELFYHENPLQPHAEPDPLSRVSILNDFGGKRAIVFHAVNSREQRMGNAPSYFNEQELAMLRRYTTALVVEHQVSPKDIGIIAPYIRQVYKMRDWLKQQKYEELEIGTVESFQGKEKKVILVSTVRANCRLLDYDAKYNLGFLVDDKRFNVALTRAKAKLVIIGNPACLVRDKKWRMYMDLCREYGTYLGHESQQLERTASLMVDIARVRFDRCRLTEALEAAIKKHKDGDDKKTKNKRR